MSNKQVLVCITHRNRVLVYDSCEGRICPICGGRNSVSVDASKTKPLIDIYRARPEEGQTVNCRVVFWRHGARNRVEMMEARYIGWNEATSHAMFDIETGDEAYPEVTHWEPISTVENSQEPEG